MAELKQWLAENALSLATFVISTFIALYLHWIEKRRKAKETRQTQDFNRWIKEQTQREIAMIEALLNTLPKPAKEELAKEMATLLPERIRLGPITIVKPSLRIAQDLLGGEVYIEARAFGNEGRNLNEEMKGIKEGHIVQFESQKRSGLVVIKKIEVGKETTNSVIFYVFRIWIQFME